MTKRQNSWKRSVLVLALAGAIGGCGQSNGDQSAAAEPTAVEVIAVRSAPLDMIRELPGRIEAVRVAEVRARVAGIVLNRGFEEGSDVKEGQVLFQIDPAPFQAVLSRAEGELAKSEAALFNARALVRRYEPLVGIEAVSKQDFDSAQASLKSALAARRSAQADVETARLNLDYATVKAPISGRIGRALVTEGALVGQNEATPMATIQQIDVVYADFRQPVAEMQKLREVAADDRTSGEEKGAPISVVVEGVSQKLDGRLMFSDITVDRTTGQVLLRGRLPNPDGLLLPGMYVRVHVSQGVDPQAILAPQRAVRLMADGGAQIVIVDENDVAQIRTVKTGAMYGANWHIVEGLHAGDKIVVEGAGNVRPGEKVSLAAPKDRPVSPDSTPDARD